MMALFPDAMVDFEADDNTTIVAVSAESNRPTPSQPIDHAFGDAISFGYDVAAESDALAVTLYWRAIGDQQQPTPPLSTH